MTKIPHDYRATIDAARSQGWTLARCRRGGHNRILAPDGSAFVTFSASPTDARALLNFRADLKRRGVIL